MISKTVLLVLFSQLNQIHVLCIEPGSQDEKDTYFDMFAPYDENGVDPHDMLPDPKYLSFRRVNAPNDVRSPLYQDNTDSQPIEEGGCFRVKNKIKDLEIRTQKCEDEKLKLEHNVQRERKAVSHLEQELSKKDTINSSAFYKRIVKHFYDLLDMKSLSQSESSYAVVRFLTVHVYADDVKAFDSFLSKQEGIGQIDSFFENRFQLEVSESQPPVSEFLHELLSFRFLKSFEFWLYTFAMLLFAFGLWALVLFIRDIQTNLRWCSVLTMMAILIFALSCMWHWRHMIKSREIKRQSFLMRRESGVVPPECKREMTWVKTIGTWVFGGADACERYYEELLMESHEEISPLMVVMETFTRFLLQPMQLLGKELGLFFKEFFDTVPFLWQLPASILLLAIVVLALFFSFGYGIDFPLWMGGIRPIRNPSSPSTEDVKNMLQDAVKKEMEPYFTEARKMVQDVAGALRVASSPTTRDAAQPAMMLTTELITEKLHQIIEQQFSSLSPVSSHAGDSQHPTACRQGCQSASTPGLPRTEDSTDCIQCTFASCTGSCTEGELLSLQEPLPSVEDLHPMDKSNDGYGPGCVQVYTDSSERDSSFYSQVESLFKESLKSENVKAASPRTCKSRKSDHLPESQSSCDSFLDQVKTLMHSS